MCVCMCKESEEKNNKWNRSKCELLCNIDGFLIGCCRIVSNVNKCSSLFFDWFQMCDWNGCYCCDLWLVLWCCCCSHLLSFSSYFEFCTFCSFPRHMLTHLVRILCVNLCIVLTSPLFFFCLRSIVSFCKNKMKWNEII